MNNAIFKEYDIRGIVGKDFNADDVYLIARAFGSVIARQGAKTVCTTYDGREDSPEFAKQLNKALMDCGLHVLDTGLGTTPMNYYAINALDADAGVMVTASHNPREYNGLKMNLRDREPFFADNIQKLIPTIESKDFVEGEGALQKVEIHDKYISRLLQDLELSKDLKVVWDNGNGAGGEILQKLVAQMPGEHTVLYGDVDGTFPNHHPDPSEHKNLKDLQAKVVELGADIGFALDGDADRIGCVTSKGDIVDNDILLAVIAKAELQERPGSIIMADVKCSKVVFDKISEYGGKPLICKTGNSNAKAKMKEINALLAGEISGHMFFGKPDFYGHDDAIYAGIKILNILNASERSMAEMLTEYPHTEATNEIRFEVPEEDKFAIVDKVATVIKSMSEFDVLDIDGIRATNSDGIVMLRASNTQNLLSIRCESLTGKEGLDRLLELIVSELNKVGVEISKSDLV